MHANIYELIHQYEQDFQRLPVKVVDGYNFNQSETIKRIHLYANGQFVDGNSDEMGDKIFFDITTPAVRNAAKNIDLDTKDIQFRAINGKENYFRSWLYRRKAKDWMREHGIARKLNEIPEKVTGIGTVVIKKIDDDRVFNFVDLRNFACDPTAKTIAEGGWTSERHYYTPSDLRKEAERGWDKDKIEEAIRDFLVHRQENYVGEQKEATTQYKKAQYICVHEFYGYVEKKFLTGDDNDMDLVLANFIVILPEDVGEKTNGRAPTRDSLGLTLFQTQITDPNGLASIYKELHYRNVAGRWLGRGIYEECFPMQETENTRGNWLLTAMRVSQLILFQTRDKTVLQNVLNNVVNGSILKFGASEVPKPMLERVDTRITDNASNNLLANNVREIIQGLTNAYEVTTGENLPSGTPFSLGALLNQNANKLFDFIREDYGLFLEEVFNDWVLPELEEEMRPESILEIIDKEEVDYLRDHFISWRVWDTIKQMTVASGLNPTRQQVTDVEQFVRAQVEKQDALYLEIPRDFLSFEKRVTCIVTDESESPAMLQTLTTILQAITANPQIVEMPAFERILDMVGLGKIDVMPRGGPSPSLPVQSPQTTQVPALSA